jgi:hypothetical protein
MLVPRRLTVPLCTVRIEHSCRLPSARRALSTSPARWPVYRTCREECFTLSTGRNVSRTHSPIAVS